MQMEIFFMSWTKRRGWMAGAAALALTATGILVASPSQAAAGQRVDLKVLVVSNGASMIDAIMSDLDREGVPYTTVDVRSSTRPTITTSFLSDSVSTGPRAKYQAVVLPDENGGGLGTDEMSALAVFESTFSIRQVDASTWANPNVGLNWADNPGYIGGLDGRIANVTPVGLAGPFAYLRGAVAFQDLDPNVNEAYGYLATPASPAYTPLVTMPIPGSDPATEGSLVGVYSHDGREELVLTFNYAPSVQEFMALAHG
jgi:hypothetical protein